MVRGEVRSGCQNAFDLGAKRLASAFVSLMFLVTPTLASAKEPRFARGTATQEQFDFDLSQCRAQAQMARDAAEAQAEARDDDTTGGIIGSGLGAMIGGKAAGKAEIKRCMRLSGYNKGETRTIQRGATYARFR